jgi:hypothetical protein
MVADIPTHLRACMVCMSSCLARTQRAKIIAHDYVSSEVLRHNLIILQFTKVSKSIKTSSHCDEYLIVNANQRHNGQPP